MTVDVDLTGARLDAAIESAIFGHKTKVFSGVAVLEHEDGQWTQVRRYSESLDDAWFVVQEMRKRGFDFTLSAASRNLWFCSFAQPPTQPSSSARAEMVTWAICWAALRAIDSIPATED